MSNFIEVSQAISTNLTSTNPPVESTKFKGSYRVYCKYNYGTVTKPSLGEALFRIEGQGKIKKGVGEDGKVYWMFIMHVEKEEDTKGIFEINKGIKQIIFKYKKQMKEFDFDPERPGAGYKDIIFYPRDDSGELVPGANPIFCLKISDYDNTKSTFECIIDQEGNTEAIPYQNLEGWDFNHSTTFCVSNVFKGQKLYPQVFVRDCKITELTEQRKVDQNKSEAYKQYVASQAEAISGIASQIEKLKLNKAKESSILQTVQDRQPEPTSPQDKSPRLPNVQMPVVSMPNFPNNLSGENSERELNLQKLVTPM